MSKDLAAEIRAMIAADPELAAGVEEARIEAEHDQRYYDLLEKVLGEMRDERDIEVVLPRAWDDLLDAIETEREGHRGKIAQHAKRADEAEAAMKVVNERIAELEREVYRRVKLDPDSAALDWQYDLHANAAYVGINAGKTAKTTELVPGLVFADFDADGKLLGVEILGKSPLSPR